MASNFDAHDARPHQSRRDDDSSSSSHSPAPTPANQSQRGGTYSSSNYYNLGHDLDQHPRASGSQRDRSRRRAASQRLKRATWPPNPTCEDEVVSLAKEAGPSKVTSSEEAIYPGTVNQEPIVQDVFIPIDKHGESATRQSGAKQTARASNLPTPPTSDDEKSRKASRRPSKLDLSFNNLKDDVPEMSKRPASPYAFTKPLRAPKDDRPAFLSPDTVASPLSTETRERRKARVGSKSQPSSSHRDSASKDYFSLSSGESAVDDTDEDTVSKSGRNKPASYPPTRLEAPRASVHTSVQDFAQHTNAVPIRKLNLDSRRNTDTSNTLPTVHKLRADKTHRPTPLASANALSDLDSAALYSSPSTPKHNADFAPPQSRETSHGSSRAVSPSRSDTGRRQDATPPRFSSEFSRDSVTTSPIVSRQSSVSGSRPTSPSPLTPGDSSRLPKTDLDWSALLAANMSRRSNPASRNAPVRHETMPARSKPETRAPPPASRNSTLPYPLNDGPSTPVAWMPEERTHQYFPDTRPSLAIPLMQEAKTLSRASSPAPSKASAAKHVRPGEQKRHYSTAELPRMEQEARFEKPGKPRAEDPRIRSGPIINTSQAKKDVEALVKKGLPACPRNRPVAGYSDWYTIIGAPSLNFCPDCIESIFDRTQFRHSFRKAPPISRSEKAVCALGGMAWIRLAWLLTLQQQRTDFDLLLDVAKVQEMNEPCPGDRHAAGPWYGLRDPDGRFVKDFHICFNDVRKIERLLPTLHGMFVPLSGRSAHDQSMCAMRAEGNRFSAYLDALIKTSEKALASRKGVDSLPFIELVEHRQQVRECTKDNLLRNQLWHYIPEIPQLTVCEDCFETVILPEAQKGRFVAMRFNQTVAPAYGEGLGSSCQMYSHRMRKVFHRAVRDDDVNYLARKVRERRDAEMRLQNKYAEIQRKAKRLSWEADGSDNEERRLDRDIRRIMEEWQLEWE